jgi:iron complex outermembrane receptor protein
MMKNRLFLFVFFLGSVLVQAQESDTLSLQPVSVQAFTQGAPSRQVPASVGWLSPARMQLFSSQSMVAAANSIAGVRMEERSPGSFRLNIRGTALRSPFGVRNIKFYFNGIPFTDPSGNTYLNQFDVGDFQAWEILLGPGSSLYGAGTGGVILAQGLSATTPNQLEAGITFGSFGLQQYRIKASFGQAFSKHQVQVSKQPSDGWRDHTKMDRLNMLWQSIFQLHENYQLRATLMVGDLNYQTPGGLTLSQYQQNPRAARPAAGPFPSAAAAQAAIDQQTIWAGISHRWQWHPHWKNETHVYLAQTKVDNPSIRNYEKRKEPHGGGRTVFTFTPKRKKGFEWMSGLEWQQGNASVEVFQNVSGQPGTVQTDDQVKSRQFSVFTHFNGQFKKDWRWSVGASLFQQKIAIQRTNVQPNFFFEKQTDWVLSPRFSLLKSIHPQWQVFGVVSKGFSAPTTAEYLPSTSVINTNLLPEYGWNQEIGTRYQTSNQRWETQLTIFHFALQDAIVQQRDAGGADFFTNAGGTQQWGIEWNSNLLVYQHPKGKPIQVRWLAGYTYSRFRYDDYKNTAGNWSGNRLPGIAPHYFTSSLLTNLYRFNLNLHYTYSDAMPLNDANTASADPFHLAHVKMTYPFKLSKKWQLEAGIAVDNLFNTTYSLGNDINAAGGRYYNAAAKRQIQGSMRIQLK